MDALPAIPYVAQRILALPIASDESERELVGLIERDPVILAKIVGLANSPLFATSREIRTLKDAMTLLGSKRVRMVALGCAMMFSMTRNKGGLLNIHGLWQHSMAVAMAMDMLARRMAKELRPQDDEVYLAGLLHDVGFLVLDYLDPAISNAFHARLQVEPERPIEVIEAEMLALDHGEMGAALARRWNLPERLSVVLNYHHRPQDPRAESGRPLVGMVSLAEKLLPTFGRPEAVVVPIAAEEWVALGIDPADEADILARVSQNAREIASIFH